MIGVEQDGGVAPAISVRRVWFSKVRSGEERDGTEEKREGSGEGKMANPKFLGFYMVHFIFYFFFCQKDVCGKRLPARRP